MQDEYGDDLDGDADDFEMMNEDGQNLTFESYAYNNNHGRGGDDGGDELA